MNEKNILDFQNKLFTIVITISWILYIAIVTGISINAPKYLDVFHYYVKIYISLFLIWRFNPFTRVTFTELDRKIAFSAGIFLFTTTSFNLILTNYTTKIKNILLKDN